MYIVALANHNNEIILLTVLLNYSYSSCIDIHPNDIIMYSWPLIVIQISEYEESKHAPHLI